MLNVNPVNVELISQYEDQVIEETAFLSRIQGIRDEFAKQPWTIALLEQRQVDNRARMPSQGRTYKATALQIRQVKRLFGKARLWLYDLIEISQEEYIDKIF